jgi:hypothetical protein
MKRVRAAAQRKTRDALVATKTNVPPPNLVVVPYSTVYNARRLDSPAPDVSRRCD